MPHPRCTPNVLCRLVVLVALFFTVAPVSAQDATPPPAGIPEPQELTEALAAAEPPAVLPGNIDAEIELVTWEEYYDEPLAGTEGAWLLTGSPELPLATMIVFSSSDEAQSGIESYRQDAAQTTIAGREAWTVADRGKWICITVTGPMIVFGQAFPEDVDEAQGEIEQRSCEVVEAALTWLSEDALESTAATPSASPTSDRST